MIINLQNIPEEGLEIAGQVDASVLEVPEIEPQGPIECRVHVSRQDDAVLVRGVLKLEALAPCARCLEGLPLSLRVEDFVFLSEDFTENELDITPAVREEILLVMPPYSKCTLDAEGNCPVNGRNWSGLDEDAVPPPLSDPWSELDKLKKS